MPNDDILSTLKAAWLIDGYSLAAERVAIQRGGYEIALSGHITHVAFWNEVRRIIRLNPDRGDRHQIDRLPRAIRAELRVL